jgi:predicted NUDIX family NTP pyrophosphohydrolase
MIISCGFLIESLGKILLCHATNGYKTPSKNDYKWGVPKGQLDGDEYYIDAALRELKEETDLDLLDITGVSVSSNHMSVQYKRIEKTLKIFKAIDKTGELFKRPLNCTTYFKINNEQLPEIDSFLWTTYDVAKTICIKGQRPIFDEQFKWEF